ncbi:rhs-associated protein, partial [Bacillus pumilus]|uniref:rhs-associated protein n=3 Tax=Bacillaceae TaxID=186817 RepID=UPI003000BC52
NKNPEIYLDLIEQKFEFDGSKIDWLQTNNHHSKNSNNESLLPDALLFITELKEKYLANNLQVIYIGDNLTEFGYQFELKHIEELLVYFLDIPQHHYFVPLEGDWCICISYENYLDFGFSLNKK